ncbi:hypothetical protein ABIF63_006133 [Bradyrhizobium japonicum]|uniref:Uncharacterized protein n=1 Tax=Bradyrhizobium japonicum TaxID=375 RepID=A0ABV2RYL4_BRAJP
MPPSFVVILVVVCIAIGAGGWLWERLGKAAKEIDEDANHRH